MPATTTAAESLWLHTAAPTDYPSLTADLQVDVAVLGGGITGLTTALLLKRDGARVAVLEAQRVAAGVTGANTAKVTALQGTVYSSIASRRGKDAAAVYADASLAGVEQVDGLVRQEGIECDLARRPAFTYAADESELQSVEQEAEHAAEAGLAVETRGETDLPYPVAGAVALDDQVAFHPVRYAQGLAAAVDGDGSVVLERTRALAVRRGSPCEVRTALGVVRARQVVVATHYPLLDRGLFFARLEPKRSYCIAARVRGELPQGMSINAGSPTRSIRSWQDQLVLGGEGHSAGSPQATRQRFEELERFGRMHWDVERISHRWSAQDPVPWDHMPVIGRYVPRSDSLFVASGFMKWGLSGGTFAAMILRDLIGGRDNPWASEFDPNRIGLRGLPKLVQLNAKAGIELVGDRLRPAEAGDSAEVPIGEARVVRDGLGKVGVYRDAEGDLHSVSLRCTHLGCLLRFNSAERSWDCPCHGSRFGVDGDVLEGPATRPLERRDPPTT